MSIQLNFYVNYSHLAVVYYIFQKTPADQEAMILRVLNGATIVLHYTMLKKFLLLVNLAESLF